MDAKTLAEQEEQLKAEGIIPEDATSESIAKAATNAIK